MTFVHWVQHQLLWCLCSDEDPRTPPHQTPWCSDTTANSISPWSFISMDFIADLPDAQGHLAMLSNYLLKFLISMLCLKIPTVEVTSQLFFNSIFKLHGLPSTITFGWGSVHFALLAGVVQAPGWWTMCFLSLSPPDWWIDWMQILKQYSIVLLPIISIPGLPSFP